MSRKTLDPVSRDFYEERRRSWRRSAFWRGVLATVLVLVILGGIGAWFSGAPTGPHIARIVIDDVIFSNPEREAMLADMATNDDVQAVVVRIDSPGGTVVGSEALYQGLTKLREEVPVVIVFDGVAASGGYLAGLGGNRIIARGNTITGSIGVILEYLTFASLMDRIGVDLETVRSSDLKAGTSQFRQLSPEARAAEQAMVDETYAWFRNIVARERNLEGIALDAATDGRTFTGRMALAAGLIDEIGDERAALKWIESQDPELEDMPVHTWEWRERESPILSVLGIFAPVGTGLGLGNPPAGPRLMSILK